MRTRKENVQKPMNGDRDYVLGTHDEELVRLGVQHRAWRSVVLDCWRKAGITVGSKVLDVGAGPGYATVDLAEIVGPDGLVVALERSAKFVRAMEEACRTRSLTNVAINELDLMTDELPDGQFDFSWCRWVLCFVSDPPALVKKIGAVLRKGGLAIFHEYGHYRTWRFAPRRISLEEFRAHVIATWQESGGEPDTGMKLPEWLNESDFAIRSATPHVFVLQPNDYMWQWPAGFIEVYLDRLKSAGRIDDAFAGKVRRELHQAESGENSVMLTPLVLEVVAEKL
jgi:ubiquinone/menaquinone biosynthesis C-methylase UbiE